MTAAMGSAAQHTAAEGNTGNKFSSPLSNDQFPAQLMVVGRILNPIRTTMEISNHHRVSFRPGVAGVCTMPVSAVWSHFGVSIQTALVFIDI